MLQQELEDKTGLVAAGHAALGQLSISLTLTTGFLAAEHVLRVQAEAEGERLAEDVVAIFTLLEDERRARHALELQRAEDLAAARRTLARALDAEARLGPAVALAADRGRAVAALESRLAVELSRSDRLRSALAAGVSENSELRSEVERMRGLLAVANAALRQGKERERAAAAEAAAVQIERCRERENFRAAAAERICRAAQTVRQLRVCLDDAVDRLDAVERTAEADRSRFGGRISCLEKTVVEVAIDRDRVARASDAHLAAGRIRLSIAEDGRRRAVDEAALRVQETAELQTQLETERGLVRDLTRALEAKSTEAVELGESAAAAERTARNAVQWAKLLGSDLAQARRHKESARSDLVRSQNLEAAAVAALGAAEEKFAEKTAAAAALAADLREDREHAVAGRREAVADARAQSLRAHYAEMALLTANSDLQIMRDAAEFRKAHAPAPGGHVVSLEAYESVLAAHTEAAAGLIVAREEISGLLAELAATRGANVAVSGDYAERGTFSEAVSADLSAPAADGALLAPSVAHLGSERGSSASEACDVSEVSVRWDLKGRDPGIITDFGEPPF